MMETGPAPCADVMEKLYRDVLARRVERPDGSRTAKLLATGTAKIAQKLGEEAIEVVIEAIRERREGVVLESADLLYQLTVLWAHMGIAPAEVMGEMARRESLFGIAEKLPKAAAKSPALADAVPSA